MKPRTLLLLALSLVGLAVPVAAPASPTPSPAQVRAAIRKATRSKGLWATVNICNSRKHRNTVGVRAQMPALGFPTTLQVEISLDYYSPQSNPDFVPLPGTRTPLSIGTVSGGYHQEGVTFLVKPPAILEGVVRFVWRSGRRVLGTATRVTSAGHRGAQQGDPAGYTAATCRIRS